MQKTGIMCIGLTDTNYAVEKFDSGENSLTIISKNLKNTGYNNIHCFISNENKNSKHYSEAFDNVTGITPDIYSLLNKAKDIFNDCENIVILHTDEPLIDFSLIERLLKMHGDNISDYTMSENFPGGISPAVISFETLKKLSMIASGNNEHYNKNSIFKIINMDINSYDIEVNLCEHDMRRDRLDFYADTKRNFLTCNNALNKLGKKPCNFDSIYEIIKESPELMRTLPAYIEIEVTGKCELDCIMCPRKRSGRTHTQMSLSDFKKIVNDIHETCDDAVICLSGMGEPFLHPDIFKMIEFVLTKTPLKLVIETSAYNFTKETADKILNLYSSCLHIIFSLESVKAQGYFDIRGKEAFNEVENNIDYYISKQTENTFLQYVKMNINEGLIDDFYDRWSKYQERIIISKYNDYRGELPKDDTHDLSPVKRFPCWHLKRDMYINAECESVLCKQDYRGEKVLGNVIKTGVLKCFMNGEEFFINDYKNGPDNYCKDCNEYYTYNF